MADEIIDSRFLQTCDIPLDQLTIQPFTLVIFGGGGDLSRRKLVPAVFHLFSENELSKGFSVLGFGRHEMTDEQYRAMMREAVAEFGEGPFDTDRWTAFSTHLFYESGHFEKEESYKKLVEKMRQISNSFPECGAHIIYYAAVPPHATPLIIEHLKHLDLCKGAFNAKVIVEKPFGNDRASAVQLNKILADAFDESQVYRIDHYLGKDPVQNIIFLRFSNSVFEQLWNCRYIDNVQISVAEDIGIEHRGGFYEETGVVRDIVQNHMMQLIGLVGMEAPIGFKADFIRDEIVKILRSIRPLSEEHIDKYMVRGQYGRGRIHGKDVPGYRQEEGVVPSSNTPTFFAGKFYIDNLRWAGVPFYVRTGKSLSRHITEICIQLKRLPLRLFGRTCDVMEPNVLVLTIQPDETISLRFNVKYPHASNKVYSAKMILNYREAFKASEHPAYERLLVDCIKGDLTLFVRQDAVEAMWEVVDPIIARWENISPGDFPNYAAGTWGPLDAHFLLEKEGRCWITD
ncbi:MAG TPA: glucose-6-phosphate dehydrogenase [Nitrospiraceae bacterium]|jgi:glucose-6-phosphate 1-dehydrogenase|nr:glucose-6-phosphate dehydrogenase [Nitrospiraceae bacterium]